MSASTVAFVALATLMVARWPVADVDRLLVRPSELSTEVVDRGGAPLRVFAAADGRMRMVAAPDKVDPLYLRLLIATEDQRFYAHRGVDPLAVLRASWQLVSRRRIVSGGSTITMQLARLAEGPRDRTWMRKFDEALLALALERRTDKAEILASYLARAPFGGAIEGVRAGAYGWLGKEPTRLSLAEAALLVAIPQAPEARRPDRHPAAAARARDRIIDRAIELGLVSRHEGEVAKQVPVPTARIPMPSFAPHLAEAARDAAPGSRRIETTIDRKRQFALERIAAQSVGMDDRLTVAILAVENGSGAVRAYIGGSDYFDSRRAGAIDHVRAVRSPGSTLKPFVYALGYEAGLFDADSMIADRRVRFGAWTPKNFDQGFRGMVTVREALQTSLNVPAVLVLNAVTPNAMIDRMRLAGAQPILPKRRRANLTIALGGLGLTLHDLVGLYTALARDGTAMPLVIRPEAVGPGRRVFQAHATAAIADILRGAPTMNGGKPDDFAFKTGTSYGYRDAWAIGFDRDWTIGVWVGRSDGTPVADLIGVELAAPILFSALFAARGHEKPRPPSESPLAVAAARRPMAAAPALVPLPSEGGVRIIFPPGNVMLEAPPAEGPDGRPAAVTLRAAGGAPPLTWFVDGEPVDRSGLRRTAGWRPRGSGLARISVVDSRGETDAVSVWVEPPH